MGSGSGDAEGHDAAPAGGENERRRPRRVVLLAVLVVVTWGITAAVFATVGAHAARSGADQARRIADTGDLSDLVNGDVDVALHAASEDFDRSRRFLASPLLVPARYLPVVGRQLRTATALAETAHRVVDSASGAVDVVRGELDVGVPGGPGRIAALDDLIAALSDLRVEIDRADLGPGDALVGPVQDARSELASRLDDARARTSDALAIARGLRDLLAGPSRYLVLAANNAEMRVGSGMFLSIGTVDFADGRLQPSSSFSPAADLLPPDPVPLPESIESLWGWSDPGSDWRNLGLSARFPPNAEVAARMWAALGRGPVDGVLVIDVPGLQAMLDVVGPVEVDGVRLDAKNVVPYLLHDQYLEADDREVNADRRERLSGLASAVLGRLSASDIDLVRLLDDLRDARDGRHLLVWSKHDDQQRAWELLGADGELEPRSLLVGLANIDGSKLDSFVRVAVDAHAEPVSGGRDVAVTLDVTVTNPTPDGEPGYVIGTDDSPDYRGLLAVHLPGAARDIGSEGDDGLAVMGRDGPTAVLAVVLDVAQGERRSVTVHFTIPADVAAAVRLEPSARVPEMNWTIDGSDGVRPPKERFRLYDP